MKALLKLLLLTLVSTYLTTTHAGVVKTVPRPKVYIISIGFGGQDWKPDSTVKQIGYNNCPTCVSDANVFVDYFLRIGKLKKKNVDSVFSYKFANGLQLEACMLCSTKYKRN